MLGSASPRKPKSRPALDRERSDLAGRMARECEGDLVRRDPGPSSRTRIRPSRPAPPLLRCAARRHRANSRKLLDHGGGPLDDFAGRDLVDELVCKDPDGQGLPRAAILDRAAGEDGPPETSPPPESRGAAAPAEHCRRRAGDAVPAGGSEWKYARRLLIPANMASCGRPARALLLHGVADIVGLDQHRRDVGRLQHHEAGLLHLRLRTSPKFSWCRTCAAAVWLAFKEADLGDVEENGSEHIVLVSQRDAADQVSAFSRSASQRACSAGGAALGQNVDRGAVDAAPRIESA